MFTYQKLYTAYLDCRKNKRKTVNALKFELDLENNLEVLLAELKDRTYRPGRSICFVVTEPTPREIFAADFRDRIVHHLLVREIIDDAENQFSHSSFACRPEKGTHRAVGYLRKIMRQAQDDYKQRVFYMQLDIKSFFMSMNQAVLYQLIEKVASKNKKVRRYLDDFLWLARLVVFHECAKNYITKGQLSLFNLIPDHKSLLKQPKGKGLPIGNYTSQFFANLYLNELDQFVKRQLRCRHYVRYVDDFILLNGDPSQLKQWKREINDFLRETLRLELNLKKTKLQPLERGIDFLGYILKPDYVLVRQKVVRRLKSKLWAWSNRKAEGETDDILATLNSYCGHFNYARSYRLKQDMYDNHLGQWREKFEFSKEAAFFKLVKESA